MQRRFNLISILSIAVIAVLGFASESAAQRPNAREVRDIVRGLNAKVDDLSYNLTYQMRSSSRSRQTIEDATSSLDELKRSISAFENNLQSRRENRDDVEAILSAAQDVNGFLRGNSFNRNIENAWSSVQDLIDRLAGMYGTTPDWNGRVSNSQRDLPDANDDYEISDDDQDDRSAPPANSGSAGFTGNLTGTYDIDRSRSENAADIIRDISLNGTNRQDLQAKLEAPPQIAIGVRGSSVTLASSNGAPITFLADGREKTEQVDGRNVRVRATLRGDELVVSSLGGETDYTVTFASEDNGRTLKVTRRITTEYLTETVFAESVYTRSDQVARLGIENTPVSDDTYSDGNYSSNDPTDRGGSRPVNSPNPTLSKPRIGEFLIANGTSVTGVLETEIDTRVSQNNDRFRMTVQSPMEYRGAVIEGYISGVGRSGQISGRSNVTFNFERITLRDGKSYDFSGTVLNIKDASGKEVRVDNEGTAKGDSQTKETAKRGGIGAGLGALIGAIAGGGKGAVIGAIIGGGAGAGSVAIMGRDDVRLMPGSTVTITSSSPVRAPVRSDN